MKWRRRRLNFGPFPAAALWVESRGCQWCEGVFVVLGLQVGSAEPVPLNCPSPRAEEPTQAGLCFLRVRPWPCFGAFCKRSVVIYWDHAKPLAFSEELKSLCNIIEERSISISFFIIHISIIYFNFL